jgi:PAS domain S-box-containing protein
VVEGLHREHRYDLILLDLQMPEMDGFQVMQALKLIATDAYMPVLVITAQPDHKLRALQSGAKDFVTKPFDLVEVQTRIHNMLEVRLLHRKLDNYNQALEKAVRERTAELRTSEARYQRFTELSSDWYWEQDAQGAVIKHSGPVQEMLGIATDGGGDGGGSVVAGDWTSAERAQIDANIAARQPFLDLVYSRNNDDGSKQYLQVSGEPMFDNASRFSGYRGVGQDITGRMRTVEQATVFRNAMDIIDQGLFLVENGSQRMLDVNATTCRMLGYTRQQMLGVSLESLGIGSAEHMATLFEALASGGDGHRQAVMVPRSNGVMLSLVIDWRALQIFGNWIMIGVIGANPEP